MTEYFTNLMMLLMIIYVLLRCVAGNAVHLFFLDTCALLCGSGAPLQNRTDFHCDQMDPSVVASNRAQQLAWLERELARSDGGKDGAPLAPQCGTNGEDAPATAARHWRVVVGHAPLLSAGKSHGTNPEMVAALMPLFERMKVHAYFNGHDHSLQHLHLAKNASPQTVASGVAQAAQTAQTHFFVSGAGGGAFIQETWEKHPHLVHNEQALGFMAVEIGGGEKKDEMRVSFHSTRAKELYAVAIAN